MSDLTTTMPILVIPAEDTDVRSAPPGALGHFHTDEGAGRHRGGTRVPRGVLVTLGVVVVAGVGLAVAGVFDGGSSPGGSAVAQAGATTSASAGVAGADAPTPTGLTDPNPAGASATDASPAATPSRSHTPTRPRPTPTLAPTPTGAGNATQPGSPGRPTSASGSAPASASNPTPTTPASSPSSSGAPALTKGMTGPAVSDMQHLLEQDQYLWWYTDGTFDQNTYDAVRNFQIDHPGTAAADGRGVYGAATRAALRADLGLSP